VMDIISKTWVIKNERDAYNIYEALVITITYGYHCLVHTYMLSTSNMEHKSRIY
jgi:hypothetical protein